jgi:hypothetical protein
MPAVEEAGETSPLRYADFIMGQSFGGVTKRRGAFGLVALMFSLGVAAACGTAGSGSVFNSSGKGDSGIFAGDSGPLPVLVVGNDGGDGASSHPNAQSIAFTPAAQTITVNGVTPGTASYTLVATFPDGSTENVSADSLEFDRPDLASVAPGLTVVLTAPGQYAGTGTLHAVYGTATTTATLTVIVQEVDTNGVPPGSISALNGATTADPLLTSLLYPYDGTVWPLGLTSPLVMWNAPNPTGDTYRLQLSQANYTYDTYATSYSAQGVPGQLRVDQSTWDRMTTSNPGGAPTPLTMTLSRYDGTNAYVSATISFTIAPASLRGAIYYWTASQDDAGVRSGHISQFRPGTGAAPVPLNQGRCMGCHAVSADGTTLVADVDDQDEGEPDASNRVPSIPPFGNWSNTRAWASFDLTQPNAPEEVQTTMFGADIALSPNGQYVVFGGPTSPPTAGSIYMSLGDPKTGTVFVDSGLDQVVGIDAGTTLMQPAFSPDGTKVAVVLAGGNLSDNVIPAAPETIEYLDFSMDAGTFAPNMHPLVNATNPVFGTKQGLAYPSFTPDSTAIAFHAGTSSTGCTGSCDDSTYDDGQLWIFPLGSTGNPILMNAATNPPLATDQGVSVEPTFNPIARGGYSWVVFTSMRDWGNALTGTSNASGQRQNIMRRLWVAAVDPTLGTIDPSHPAIYLEGQEDTPNMRGFWALASCTASVSAGGSGDDGGAPDAGGACGAGFECCSGFCEQGVCVDVSTVACVGAGGTCVQTSDCCNAGPVQCLGGTCGTEAPK